MPLIMLFGWNLIARYLNLRRVQLRVKEQELRNRREGIELVEGTGQVVTNGNIPSPVAGLPRVGYGGFPGSMMDTRARSFALEDGDEDQVEESRSRFESPPPPYKEFFGTGVRSDR